MLAWMVVVAAWGVGFLILTYLVDIYTNDKPDWTIWLAAISILLLVTDGVWFLIWATLWYLEWMQAWPFTPS